MAKVPAFSTSTSAGKPPKKSGGMKAGRKANVSTAPTRSGGKPSSAKC